MFNPFAKFEQKFIPRFRQMKKRYLVAQTFTRDNDLLKDHSLVSLLLSHYDDLILAKTHLNALSGDKYAAIVDLENHKHRERLEAMLKDEEKYHIYSCLVLDPKAIEGAMNTIFAAKVKKYITAHTRWRIGGDKTIRPGLEITFGELFVVLKYAGETLRVNLQEIEHF